MKKNLLRIFAVSLICFSSAAINQTLNFIQKSHIPICLLHTINQPSNTDIMDRLAFLLSIEELYPETVFNPLNKIKTMLEKPSYHLRAPIIEKALAILRCSGYYKNHSILTLIDYSLPANAKRLWIFDLNHQQLLFNTYVAHGIKSGVFSTNHFSNKYDSKSSSIGVYKTENSYYGRDGLSLKLNGLEQGFNNNAYNRAVVMHGAWYAEENFVKKYARTGRSWGCPAVPHTLSSAIINTIKDHTLLVIYYPDDEWFLKSRFLTCKALNKQNLPQPTPINKPTNIQDAPSESIIFADLNKNGHHEENEPVLVVNALTYEKIFNRNAPVTRMLRRQINQAEYIALTANELNNQVLSEIIFVIPELKMRRGYWTTDMKVIPYGNIKTISTNKPYSLTFDGRGPISIQSSNQFIRWLGL